MAGMPVVSLSIMRFCYVRPRLNDLNTLLTFSEPGSGDALVRLDGYAIIPREEYDELLRAAGRPTTGYVPMEKAQRIVGNELVRDWND